MRTIERIRRAHAAVRARGLGYVVGRQLRRRLARRLVEGKVGLEVGGPSRMFEHGGEWPAYFTAGSIDNVNFAARTVWEGAIEEGRTFRFAEGREPGRQWIAEAGDLAMVPAASYDFLLSSHTLEHCANPIAVLREWARVVRPGGALLIALPHKDGTFDRRRPVTTLDHLIADEVAGVGEDDPAHVAEFLDLYDNGGIGVATHPAEWVERCRDNLRHRVVHHHVFDTELAVATLRYAGLRVLHAAFVTPQDILLAARVPAGINTGN